MAHSNTMKAKSRVCQSQVCYSQSIPLSLTYYFSKQGHNLEKKKKEKDEQWSLFRSQSKLLQSILLDEPVIKPINGHYT